MEIMTEWLRKALELQELHLEGHNGRRIGRSILYFVKRWKIMTYGMCDIFSCDISPTKVFGVTFQAYVHVRTWFFWHVHERLWNSGTYFSTWLSPVSISS